MDAATQHGEVAKLYEQVLFSATNAQDMFQTAVTILQTSSELMGAVHEIVHSLREYTGQINFPVRLQADLGKVAWNVDHVRRMCKAKKSACVHFDHLYSVAAKVAEMKAFVQDNVEIGSAETERGRKASSVKKPKGNTVQDEDCEVGGKNAKRRTCPTADVERNEKQRKKVKQSEKDSIDDDDFIERREKQRSVVDVVNIDDDHGSVETPKSVRRTEPRAAKNKKNNIADVAGGTEREIAQATDASDASGDEDDNDDNYDASFEAPLAKKRNTRLSKVRTPPRKSKSTRK